MNGRARHMTGVKRPANGMGDHGHEKSSRKDETLGRRHERPRIDRAIDTCLTAPRTGGVKGGGAAG
jgi:hypothetical protein